VINHRREKRFQQTLRAVIKFGSGSSTGFRKKEIVAETYDICVGGARIITPKFFPIGTVVRIQIELMNSEQILKIDGEVKWSKKIPDEDHYEFGLEFKHEIPRTIMSLLGYLYGESQRIPSTVQAAECR
jgi:hypothetical protein